MDANQSAPIIEINQVLSHYALGELFDYERNDRGYINVSYSITTIKNGLKQNYFLRRYKTGIMQEEIVFEHSVIKHVVERGFTLVAKVINTRDGNSFYFRYERGDLNRPIYYAIFEYLPGVDKYTWDGPDCTLLEIKNSASILAQFHHAVAGFAPNGRRFEPGIIELIPLIAENIQKCLENSKGTIFDRYLQKYSNLILDTCKFAENYLSNNALSNCPISVIHCDFHPGNLKFDGEQVVGLFDFDWSKLDYRCFDLALAIWYFSTSWKNETDGVFSQEKSGEFLTSYESTLSHLSGGNALNSAEQEHLSLMITLANLYILNWTISDFYAKEVDPAEYLVYLRHGINFIRHASNSSHDTDRNVFKNIFLKRID
ncbi:MAG: phosphotransferase [Anaerolineales bacterium]